MFYILKNWMPLHSLCKVLPSSNDLELGQDPWCPQQCALSLGLPQDSPAVGWCSLKAALAREIKQTFFRSFSSFFLLLFLDHRDSEKIVLWYLRTFCLSLSAQCLHPFSFSYQPKSITSVVHFWLLVQVDSSFCQSPHSFASVPHTIPAGYCSFNLITAFSFHPPITLLSA